MRDKIISFQRQDAAPSTASASASHARKTASALSRRGCSHASAHSGTHGCQRLARPVQTDAQTRVSSSPSGAAHCGTETGSCGRRDVGTGVPGSSYWSRGTGTRKEGGLGTGTRKEGGGDTGTRKARGRSEGRHGHEEGAWGGGGRAVNLVPVFAPVVDPLLAQAVVLPLRAALR